MVTHPMIKDFQTRIKPSVDKKPYRLKCRFMVPAHASREWVWKESRKIEERFVADMRSQGWEHCGQFQSTVKGPFPQIKPVIIHATRTPSAQEMLPLIQQGARFLDAGGTTASDMPTLETEEYWEFELAAVFIRDAILTEYPDLHEELR